MHADAGGGVTCSCTKYEFYLDVSFVLLWKDVLISQAFRSGDELFREDVWKGEREDSKDLTFRQGSKFHEAISFLEPKYSNVRQEIGISASSRMGN